MSRKNALGLSSEDYEKLYNVWKNMRQRCYDIKSERYYTYGARSIRVCDEWKDSFREFAKWAYDNGWNPTLSIERINLDKDYSPSNCKFITMKEQARNKTSNVRIIINGVDKCLAEWCEIYGVPYKRVHRRYSVYGIRNPPELFFDGDLRSFCRTKEVFG